MADKCTSCKTLPATVQHSATDAKMCLVCALIGPKLTGERTELQASILQTFVGDLASRTTTIHAARDQLRTALQTNVAAYNAFAAAFVDEVRRVEALIPRLLPCVLSYLVDAEAFKTSAMAMYQSGRNAHDIVQEIFPMLASVLGSHYSARRLLKCSFQPLGEQHHDHFIGADVQDVSARRGEGNPYQRRYLVDLLTAALAYNMQNNVDPGVFGRRVGTEIKRLVPPSPQLQQQVDDALRNFHLEHRLEMRPRVPAKWAPIAPPSVQTIAQQFVMLFMRAVQRNEPHGVLRRIRVIFRRVTRELSRVMSMADPAGYVAQFLIAVLSGLSGGPPMDYSAAYRSYALQNNYIGTDGTEINLKDVGINLFSRYVRGKRYDISKMADMLLGNIADAMHSAARALQAATLTATLETTADFIASEIQQQREVVQRRDDAVKVFGALAREFFRTLPPSPSGKTVPAATFIVSYQTKMRTPVIVAQQFTEMVLYYGSSARAERVPGQEAKAQQDRLKTLISDSQSLYRKMVRELQRVSGYELTAQEIVGTFLSRIFWQIFHYMGLDGEAQAAKLAFLSRTPVQPRSTSPLKRGLSFFTGRG